MSTARMFLYFGMLAFTSSTTFFIAATFSRSILPPTLSIWMMASVVDKKTGIYTGENCHGKEKVRRFYERYPQGKIEEFYSDSYSDTPLAKLAKRAYIVKDEEISDWVF